MPSRDLWRLRLVFGATALAIGLYSGASTAQVSPPPPGLDVACVAKCQQTYDEHVTVAASKLSAKRYFVGPSASECPTPWDTTRSVCAATFYACDGKCGVYDAACKAPCFSALQPCCQAADIGNAAHAREVCLAACPKSAAPPEPPARPARMTTPPEPTVERSMTREITVPREDFDSWRRSRALDQVQSSLWDMKASFAVVSGGDGRIWIVKSNGERVQLSTELAAALRLCERGYRNQSEERAYEAASVSSLALLRTMGFGPEDAGHIVYSIKMSGSFKPGEVMYFPPDGRWPKEMLQLRASSEHSSIRGTINGGGDFI